MSPLTTALIAAAHTLTAAPAVPPALDADDERPACGWFDSSHALREGLAVSELPDSDGSVAALWFAQLAPAGSARWQ